MVLVHALVGTCGAFGSRRRLAPTQSQTTFYAQDPWLSLPWALQKPAVPTPLLLALSQARAAGLQPSFHPRSNRSPPCGRGRVAASTQRSYVARRPGPRRPRSAVRRACGLAGLGTVRGRCTVGQEGPVTRSESLDDAGGNTVHVNKRTSRYLRVLTELFQLVKHAHGSAITEGYSLHCACAAAPYH